MCGNARKRIQKKLKKKEKTKEPVLQRAGFFLSQARQHAKKLERVLYMNWLVSAGKKGHNNQRK